MNTKCYVNAVRVVYQWDRCSCWIRASRLMGLHPESRCCAALECATPLRSMHLWL